MADRGMIVRWQRRVGRSTVMIALLIAGLGASALALRYGWAARAAAVTTLELSALPTQPEVISDEKGAGVVVAGFEGSFDPRTKQLVLKTPSDEPRARKAGGQVDVRVDPNGEVPRTTGFTFSVVNSTFIQTGDLAGNVSGEIQLMNKTGVTLYNTRLVFVRFAVCPTSGTCNGQTAQTNATTTPGQTGFAYYNDGLIPYQGRLNVSRAYGDIPPNGMSNAVWSFNVSTNPARFFFSFVVLADIGVAAESVYPAAVQVNGNNGAGVVIRGRNFSGTPTVQLLDGNGNVAATLTNVSVPDSTQINGTVPPGTAAGVYSVRATLAGGTPGGTNSSTILRRLTVTAVPTATLTGNVGSLPGSGPFLVSSDITINAGVTVPPGTVFYLGSGARVIVAGSGNLNANGGVPGVPNGAGVGTPTQIVFTAQRSPGAALPTLGAWGGIDATAAAANTTMTMRNVVIEYGGANNKPNLDITGSGRTLRFTDSLARHSAGAGLAAGGSGDMLTGFARNRIEYNGQVAGTPALIASGNAALGLYEIPATTGVEATPLGTFATDPSYFYTGANVFMGNQLNAVQIPDTNAATNDFTRSGVLVGQGDTPIQIRGSNTNPAIIGATPPSPPAEVVISPSALIQLAAGTDFQAGDYGTNRVGCLAANGFAGVNQFAGAALNNSRYIVFDKIGTGGNWGAIFFARNSTSSCVLNFVQVRNGGVSELGRGAVILDGVNVNVKNTQVTGSSTGSIVELNGAVVFSNGTTSSGNNQQIIDTIAGGRYGDGNVGKHASLISLALTALDPQGRGVYLLDATPDGKALLRFLNTTRNPVMIGGIRIAGGTLKVVAGGGLDLSDNVAGLDADLGAVTGLAVSPGTGDVVYFIDQVAQIVRFFNVSSSSLTINNMTIGSGRVGTFSTDTQFRAALSGLATRANGEVLVVDATPPPDGCRVYKISPNGGAAVPFAGNKAATAAKDAFSAGAALNIPLLQPRGALPDADGNVYIADTGHGRVIKIDVGGQASLIAQFTAGSGQNVNVVPPYDRAPYPTGMALHNNKLYIALGNAQQIVTAQGTTPTKVAGSIEVACDYSTSRCGDGGPFSAATFYLLGQSSSPPIASIVSNANGLFVCDQGQVSKGRLRYINLSNTAVEVAGVSIAANSIDTVAGSGLPAPFDNGLATSAEFNSPQGVAVDPTNGNLWITDTLSSRLRYVNRTSSPVTLFAAAGAGNSITVMPGHIVTINRDVGVGETDDVPAVQGGLDTPQGLFVTDKGVYLVDTKKGPALLNPINRRTSLIRFINTTSQDVVFYAGSPNQLTVRAGYIRTIVGGGSDRNEDVNDGPDPLDTKLLGSSDIVVATNGDMYIADNGNGRVRRVLASNGAVSTLQGLGGAIILGKTTATNQYTGLAFDATGRLLTVDTITNRLLREKTPGSGANANGFDTLLTGAPLNKPRDLVFDAAGNLYVTNTGDHRVLRLTISGNSATGITLTGSTAGYSGDFGPANLGQVNFTSSQIIISTLDPTPKTVPTLNSIAVGLSGEIIFVDPRNNAVRRVR